MTTAYDFHPIADLFPLMEGAEFDELVADIKAMNGLHQPIALLGDKILDGRNRYRACKAAGVRPNFTHLPAVDPLTFVISANLHRRHLTAEQKREVIAKLLKAQPEKSDREIGKTAKVDHKTVGTARAMLEGRGEIPHVETRTDTKGRKQPAKKKNSAAKAIARLRKAREYREAKEKREREAAAAEDRADIAAHEAEAEQIAIDLLKQIDRNLAARLHAHLPEGMWLKDALGRGLGSEGNGADHPTAPCANDDDLDIPECLRRVSP
jgi:hypothetical protein